MTIPLRQFIIDAAFGAMLRVAWVVLQLRMQRRLGESLLDLLKQPELAREIRSDEGSERQPEIDLLAPQPIPESLWDYPTLPPALPPSDPRKALTTYCEIFEIRKRLRFNNIQPLAQTRPTGSPRRRSIVKVGPASPRSTYRVTAMKKILTEEQKQQRAETARRNGAKSKGPVTIEGKHRSSMNAITVGKYVEVHDEDIPAYAPILTVEDRKAYVRLHQANLRQYRPNSEAEHHIVRHITAEQFEHERFCNLELLQLQSEYDGILRECVNMPLEDIGHHAVQRSINNDKIHRFLERKRKAHLAAWTKFVALYEKLRKVCPMAPPEPVDITADSAVLEQPDPPQPVIDGMTQLAERAQKEPNFRLPDCVVYFIHDERLIKKYAPHLDVRELRKRYPDPDARRAA